MPFEDGKYSQDDIGNKLSRAITAIGKNNLQDAMHAMVDALGMIEKNRPDLGKVEDWLTNPATSFGLRSGLESGPYAKSSINQEITRAILYIGHGAESMAAVRKIIKAMKMLIWLAGTKQKVLAITSTPAEQARVE